ncbi:unnamed protein product [Rotaria sordida]|uniref:Major facilitator superfamily (MFS) profile domain-containing protein n=1 Tax=Rotaria sordida TaxID=392033 RepID=A0A815AGW1_9BILA|nr:unnamed protein product [Rotaria sordida]CAF1537647.1 unnamed protein product [Rotaria sordida]
MGIKSDLNLLQSERNWDISLFFLAYLIFAVPSKILMRYLGATRYLSLSLVVWGSITVGLAFVRNARELLSVQFLLGVTQAGFFPSIVIYFSFWYRKRDQTMRIAILFGASIISSALSGILAYGFIYLDGIRGLNSWQWMFLLEGLPMIPLGIITCLFLSNIPDTVQWLNNSEKQLLTNLLRHDAGIANGENVRLSWRQRSIAIGFVVGIGQIGGIILPFVHYDKSTNRRNIFIYFGTVVASLVLVIILRICLILENRWRDNLSREKYDRIAAIKESCDWHPQVRYVL